MPEQAMPRGKIPHAPAAKAAPRAPGDLPALVQLFARQAAGLANHTRDFVEQGVPGKARQVTRRQDTAATGMERGR